MKRLIYIFAAMLVIPVSCDKFHVYSTSGNGSGNNGSSSEQGGGGDQGGQEQGNDQYSIKGAVKTITLECIRPKSGGGGNITSSKDIKTIIYDEKPARNK